MVGTSSLRSSGYLPLHGSWWDKILNGSKVASNPFNELSNAPERIARPSKQVDHCKQCLPCPRWSARQLSNWLRDKLSCPEDKTIWSIISCWQYCVPTPSITTTRNGLFPVFYNDIFGIQGVPGLSQWILGSARPTV